MRGLVGVDYGGTHTKLLLAREGESGLVGVRTRIVATAEAASTASLARCIAAFVGGDDVAAFGVTIAGILDEADGDVHASVNMPWLVGSRPALQLADALGIPGVAVNDGAAAATAEAVLGAGRGKSDVFVVALGTGIAGAHVMNGRVRRGAHGAAGEVGHVSLGGTRECSCGQRGCLETEIGGRRLAERWAQACGDPAVTAKDLVAAAEEGSADAAAILDEATTALARGLLGVVAVVDPAVIVVGGGVAQARAQIVDPAIAKVRASATFHRLPPIIPAELGVWAGAWGAVLGARGVAEA